VRDQLVSNVAVAFAVTYLVGLITAVWVLSVLGPKLMRVDLAAECRELETKMGAVSAEPGVLSAYTRHAVRGYQVTARWPAARRSNWKRCSVASACSWARRQADGIKDSSLDLVLQAGDTVALAATATFCSAPRTRWRPGSG
jgi:putative transport protein